MMWRTAMAAVVLAGAASACAPMKSEPGGRYAAGHFIAEAELHNASGARVGKAGVRQKEGQLEVTVSVMGMSPGPHGVHIHTTGKCDAPDFTTAGGHWNPAGRHHGMENAQGPHAGDIPNLMVGADGRGTLRFMLTGGTFDGLLDQDGAAFVVHAGPDDMKSDPAGNSGGRIACGVFAAK